MDRVRGCLLSFLLSLDHDPSEPQLISAASLLLEQITTRPAFYLVGAATPSSKLY